MITSSLSSRKKSLNSQQESASNLFTFWSRKQSTALSRAPIYCTLRFLVLSPIFLLSHVYIFLMLSGAFWVISLDIVFLFICFLFSWYILLPNSFISGEGNSYPLQYSCLEIPMDGGAWLAHGVAKSQTRLSNFTSTHSWCLVLFCFCFCCFGGFPGGSDGKEPTCSAGDLGSVPGSEGSSVEGNDNPLQCYCLESSMGRAAWCAVVPGVAKNWTQLSN